MNKILTILLCLAILALVIGCAKLPKESLSSTISTEISGFGDLDESLDVSDLDALDADLVSALEGLEI